MRWRSLVNRNMGEGRLEFVSREGVRTFSCSHDVLEVIATIDLIEVLLKLLNCLITAEHLTFPTIQLYFLIPLPRRHQAYNAIQLMHIVSLGILLCPGEKFILLLLPRKARAAMSKLA